MKSTVHARLSAKEREILEELKKSTGLSESELVRRGLELLDERDGGRSALDLAGSSVGKFRNGPRDLALNKRHLDDFGR